MSERVTSQKLGSRASAVTHLPLALHQLLKFMLLGLQDLLHLGAEGQAPGVALGSREVSAPRAADSKSQQGRASIPHAPPPPRPGVQGPGCLGKAGSQDSFPGSGRDGVTRWRPRERGLATASLCGMPAAQGVRGPPPAGHLLPRTGQGPAPLLSQQRRPGPGSGRGAGGATSACSCCFSRRICCSISSWSCWTSWWCSESRLEGAAGGAGPGSH